MNTTEPSNIIGSLLAALQRPAPEEQFRSIFTPEELEHYPLYNMPGGSLFSDPLVQASLTRDEEELEHRRAEGRQALYELMTRPLNLKPEGFTNASFDPATGVMSYGDGAAPAITDDGELPIWMRPYENFPHSHNEHKEGDDGEAS